MFRLQEFFVASVIITSFTSVAMAMGRKPETKPPVETVKEVDLKRYMGLWYEVAAIPQSFQKQCIGNTTAEYSEAEEGRVRVINSCDTAVDGRSIAEGRAKVTDLTTNAKLKVTFVKLVGWIFAFGGNYWILDLADDYSFAVIGDDSRKYAWILSRTPFLTEAMLHRGHDVLKKQGFDTCKVLTSVQTGGFTERRALCELVATPELNSTH